MPSARGWLIDLSGAGGPQFTVLRLGSVEARCALADHLTEVGTFADRAEAREAIDGALVSSLGVVW